MKPDHLPMSSPVTYLRNYTAVALLLWSATIALSLFWSISDTKKHTLEIIRNEADVYFKKDLAVRYWAASHGGVYVPVDARTRPSPYLSHIPERDIITPEGKLLTLMNPAFVIRQIMQQYTELYGVKGHLSSLTPLNPDNAPDEWETTALKSFGQGAQEMADFVEIQGRPHYRLMRSMKVEADCMKCHASQGYAQDDLHGGFSISIPIESNITIERKQIITLSTAYGCIWLLGCIGIFFGASRLRHSMREHALAEAEVARSEKLLRRIAENYPNSYVSIINRDMTVGFTSGQEFQRQGIDPQQYEGQPLQQVFAEHYPVVREHYEQAFAGHESSFELTMNNQIQLYRAIPLYEDDGQIQSILAVAENITATRQAELLLRKREEQLSEAQNIAHIGCWELDLRTNELMWSDEIYRIFEMDPARFDASYEAFLNAIHPHDRSMVNEAFTQSLQSHIPYDIVHRLLMPDGRVKYVNEKCMSYYDDNGTPLRSIGTIQDITARKIVEDQLIESEERYRTLFDSDLVGIAIVDGQGNIAEANTTFCSMLGYTRQEMSSVNFREISHEDELAENITLYQELMRGQRRSYSMEKKYLHKQGHIIWGNLAVFGVYDTQGTYRYGFAMIRDITRRKHFEEQLQRSLQEKSVLLAEVHHRVKNNMQVISSLLSLQAPYILDPPARQQFMETRSRIRSMALAHEMIYRSSDFAHIAVKTYVESLIRRTLSLCAEGSPVIRTTVGVADVQLDIDMRVPVGLILNELITNSIKHAFGNRTGEGRIEISMQYAEPDQVSMRYRDNGPGLPGNVPLEELSGLGLRLVLALVEQIMGTLEVHNHAGAEFIFKFPRKILFAKHTVDG